MKIGDKVKINKNKISKILMGFIKEDYPDFDYEKTGKIIKIFNCFGERTYRVDFLGLINFFEKDLIKIETKLELE